MLLGFWGFFLALRYKKNCQLYHVVVTFCDSCRIDSHNETLCLSLALPHFLPYLLSLSHTLSLAFSHSLSLSPVFFHHIPRDSGLCPRCFSLFNSKLSFSTTCQSVISALRKKRKKQKTKKKYIKARKRSGKVQQGTVLEKKSSGTKR